MEVELESRRLVVVAGKEEGKNKDDLTFLVWVEGGPM